jgi:hypothetical protein
MEVSFEIKIKILIRCGKMLKDYELLLCQRPSHVTSQSVNDKLSRYISHQQGNYPSTGICLQQI